MTTKVIESLIIWDNATRPKQQARQRAGAQWEKPNPGGSKRGTHHADRDQSEDESSHPPETGWVTRGVRNLGGGPKKADGDAVASCKVIRFDAAEAECEVKALGFEMPSVSLPAWVLRANNLKEGDRFYWIMRDGGHISPADIDTEVSRSASTAQLSAVERAELEDLYQNSRIREREGEEWKEYTGDGR